MHLPPFLKRRVVELLVMAQQRGERRFLGRVRIELVRDLAAIHALAYILVTMALQELDTLLSLRLLASLPLGYRNQVSPPRADQADARSVRWTGAGARRSLGRQVLEVNGEAEHVHLLFTLPRRSMSWPSSSMH
jgi:hypothetical protein